MKGLMLLSLFAVSLMSQGQSIYITKNKAEADFKIFIEKEWESKADWVVMKTEWESSAGNGVWFFTDTKSRADIVIYIEENRNSADKVVFYTTWSTNIKFKR